MKILDFGRNVLQLSYSPLQEVVLLSLAGEHLDADQAELYRLHTGRPWSPVSEIPDESIILAGRQSGKTSWLGATLILYHTFDPATVEGLGPGQVRDVLCIAPTVRQAKIMYGRVRALVESRPQLRRHLQGEPTQWELSFDFGVRLGVWPSRGSHIRGLQAKLLLLDEAAFLPCEGPHADRDILEAIRPSMAVVPGSQIISITTPWVRLGYVYEAFRHRGDVDNGVLVFQASSHELNPGIPTKFLDKERRRDPDYFRREYLAEFVDSISAYLPSESIAACTVNGRSYLPPEHGIRYAAALDAAYRRRKDQ